MYGVEVYITPEDILNKLSDKDRERFNKCTFTDVVKGMDGSVQISCLLFDDRTLTKEESRRKLTSYDQDKINLLY